MAGSLGRSHLHQSNENGHHARRMKHTATHDFFPRLPASRATQIQEAIIRISNNRKNAGGPLVGGLEKSKDISEVKNHCRNSFMGLFCDKMSEFFPARLKGIQTFDKWVSTRRYKGRGRLVHSKVTV